MWLQAGRLLNQKGDYAAALQYLRKVSDELPKSALAWYELGCCQARMGRPEAKMSFEQARKRRYASLKTGVSLRGYLEGKLW